MKTFYGTFGEKMIKQLGNVLYFRRLSFLSLFCLLIFMPSSKCRARFLESELANFVGIITQWNLEETIIKNYVKLRMYFDLCIYFPSIYVAIVFFSPYVKINWSRPNLGIATIVSIKVFSHCDWIELIYWLHNVCKKQTIYHLMRLIQSLNSLEKFHHLNI